jgi:hypothetical protein
MRVRLQTKKAGVHLFKLSIYVDGLHTAGAPIIMYHPAQGEAAPGSTSDPTHAGASQPHR